MDFALRDDEEDNVDRNAGDGESESPSVIDDNELLAREKREALATVHDAVWSVSSAKHGNGVTCLLDGSHSTFWQSDGILPHAITIDFSRLTPVAAVALYLDYQQDESYTPRKMRVQAGTHGGDMADVANVTVDDPQGWVLMRMTAEAEAPDPSEVAVTRSTESGTAGRNTHGNSAAFLSSSPSSPSSLLFAAVENDDYAEFLGNGVWCTHLRIVLEENRQNGRDCHVRGARVLGPARQSSFTTPDFMQHLFLR